MLRKTDQRLTSPLTKQGFTLIETILALGIFAIVAVSTYVTFYNGIKLNRQINNWDEFYQRTLSTVNILTQDLENMLAYHYSEKTTSLSGTKLGIRSVKNVEVRNLEIKGDAVIAPEQEKNIFRGDATSLTLLIQKNGQLKVVRYYLREFNQGSEHTTIMGEHTRKNKLTVTDSEESRDVYEFVREEIPFNQAFEESQPESSAVRVLISPVKQDAIQFVYADLDMGGQETVSWGKVWDNNLFPVMVGFELTYFDPQLAAKPMKFRKNILIPLRAWSASATTP